MLEVTPSAHERFAEYFNNQDTVSAIRVFLNQQG